ncbi:MAG: hypothetical protein CVU56_01765 [Deltaproteobacteria bacterium HGW-Deltaproteobacteria-14]|nr:MAG: hypothetical protein CVU56_01765 [Deltaproteobacteria bacterium HGW-Deltaproteobacteria-14]
MLSSGCVSDAPADGGSIAVAIAPLDLPGLTNATYTLTVTNGAAGTGEVVWQRTLDADQYGDGAGSLAFVGPCDAGTALNSVALEIDALYDANGLIPATTYRDPSPISRDVACVANGDVQVTFDMTIVRDARQGFFDVAVEFEDVFCSAKLDCVRRDTGGDLELLHNPLAGGRRDLTAVLAFACTGAPGGPTFLYMDDVVVTCTTQQDVTVDAGGLGNASFAEPPAANPGDYLFAAAVYRGNEGLASKAYWEVALGLNDAAFASAGVCTLRARGTAASAAFVETVDGFALPAGAVYPVIEWDVPLTNTTSRVCTSHEIDGGDGVATVYRGYPAAINQFTWASEPIYLRHEFNATSGEVTSTSVGDCEDGRLNQDETGVDCGGATCGACGAGAGCLVAADCASGLCVGEVCQAPSCGDGLQNGDETGVDCGGSACASCFDCGVIGPCPAGFACSGGTCVDTTGGEVWVPAGTAWLGCTFPDPTYTWCSGYELPVQLRTYPTGYFVDRREVRVVDYAACVAANACTLPGYTSSGSSSATYGHASKQNHPVNYVDWYQAAAYCAWKGRRLCTGYEWERAARGGCEFASSAANCKAETRRYPWGSSSPYQCNQCNFSECSGAYETRDVGSFSGGSSLYGAQDMAGNIAEWANEPFNANYIQRGGHFGSNSVNVASLRRSNQAPDSTSKYAGIRCCRSPQ